MSGGGLIPSVWHQYALPFDVRYVFSEVTRIWEIDETGMEFCQVEELIYCALC